MAVKGQKVYVVTLNAPSVGVQVLGTFNSKNSCVKFIDDHKVFLTNAHTESKKKLSVDYDSFMHLLELSDMVDVDKLSQDALDNVKKIIEENHIEYNMDNFENDLHEVSVIDKISAMAYLSSYHVYETEVGLAKHLIPKF